MTKPQRRAVTASVDRELRRMGFAPTEISIKGRIFIATLAENIRLKGELDGFMVNGKKSDEAKRKSCAAALKKCFKLSKRENKKAVKP